MQMPVDSNIQTVDDMTPPTHPAEHPPKPSTTAVNEENPTLPRMHHTSNQNASSMQNYSQEFNTKYTSDVTIRSPNIWTGQPQITSPLLSESKNNKLKPRHTTHYNSWHYKDMIRAIKSVQTKMLSMTAAAKRYNIPRTTLRHYLNDGTNKEAKRVGFFLQKEQENILVDYALHNSHLTEQQLYKYIFEKAKELSQSPTTGTTCSSASIVTDDGKEERRNIPTPAWIRRFVYRQKQLHTLFPTLLTRIEHPLHGGKKMFKNSSSSPTYLSTTTDTKRTLYKTEASKHQIEAIEHQIEARGHVSMVNTTGIYFPSFRDQYHKTRSPTHSHTRSSRSSSDSFTFTRGPSASHDHSRQSSSESYSKPAQVLENFQRDTSGDLPYIRSPVEIPDNSSFTRSRQSPGGSISQLDQSPGGSTSRLDYVPGSSIRRLDQSPDCYFNRSRSASLASSTMNSPRQTSGGNELRDRCYSFGEGHSSHSEKDVSPTFNLKEHKTQSTAIEHGGKSNETMEDFNNFNNHVIVKMEQQEVKNNAPENCKTSTSRYRCGFLRDDRSSPALISVDNQRVSIPKVYNSSGHTYHETSRHNNYSTSTEVTDTMYNLELRVMTRTLETMEEELGPDYVQLFTERFERSKTLERLYCQWLQLKTNVERLEGE